MKDPAMLASLPARACKCADRERTVTFSPKAMETLELLRAASSRARVARRLDLYTAWALLDPILVTAADAFAEALLRTLSHALGRRTVFFRAGCESLSFDEAWLLRLIDCFASGDLDSVTFLLHRRVHQHYRRSLLFLFNGVVDNAQAA